MDVIKTYLALTSEENACPLLQSYLDCLVGLAENGIQIPDLETILQQIDKLKQIPNTVTNHLIFEKVKRITIACEKIRQQPNKNHRRVVLSKPEKNQDIDSDDDSEPESNQDTDSDDGSDCESESEVVRKPELKSEPGPKEVDETSEPNQNIESDSDDDSDCESESDSEVERKPELKFEPGPKEVDEISESKEVRSFDSVDEVTFVFNEEVQSYPSQLFSSSDVIKRKVEAGADIIELDTKPDVFSLLIELLKHNDDDEQLNALSKIEEKGYVNDIIRLATTFGLQDIVTLLR